MPSILSFEQQMRNLVPAAVRSGEARRIHLIAICGVAMSALAGMLKKRGYEVSGSDENVYPPMSTVLERLGISIRQGFSAENLADRPDLVVVGNKVSRSNTEVQAMLASDLPFVSLPQALAELFLLDRTPLVVAGTHGKTTSTAMLAWVLEHAGYDPSVLVGGEALDFRGNYKLGGGPHFVIEGDEYDTAFFDKGPKFLHYRPHAILLNAVEFDHADIYRDLQHVKDAFRELIALLPDDGPLVVCSDFPEARDVARVRSDTITFGWEKEARWRVMNLREENGTAFEILDDGEIICTVRLRQPGAINARNALGVFALARAAGLSAPEIVPGLESFSGVARRQEWVGDFGGITLIDDFAHHPTAVAGTLAAMRLRYPRRRLWAVFEPRSNTSRRKVFQRDYLEAFRGADRVIIGGVFRKESDALEENEMFSPQQLARDLEEKGVRACAYEDSEAIIAALLQDVRPDDVIVLMSNGSFGGLRNKLAGALAKTNG